MRLIDEQFLETPFHGSRQMVWHLRRLGHWGGHQRARQLMRLMGVRQCIRNRAPARRIPNTSSIPTFYAMRRWTCRSVC